MADQVIIAFWLLKEDFELLQSWVDYGEPKQSRWCLNTG